MVDVVSLASKNGYTVDFDYMEGTTKLYTPQNLEIEFLIPQYGVGDARVIPTNLDIKAAGASSYGYSSDAYDDGFIPRHGDPCSETGGICGT